MVDSGTSAGVAASHHHALRITAYLAQKIIPDFVQPPELPDYAIIAQGIVLVERGLLMVLGIVQGLRRFHASCGGIRWWHSVVVVRRRRREMCRRRDGGKSSLCPSL